MQIDKIIKYIFNENLNMACIDTTTNNTATFFFDFILEVDICVIYASTIIFGLFLSLSILSFGQNLFVLVYINISANMFLHARNGLQDYADELREK